MWRQGGWQLAVLPACQYLTRPRIPCPCCRLHVLPACRKRSGEEHAPLMAAKRPQSGDLQQQQAALYQQQQQQAAAQQQQAHILQQQQAPQGWPSNC